MKKLISLVIFVCISFHALAQDSLLLSEIDRTVKDNEGNVSIVYQKTEKNRIESMHGKNPSHVVTIFKIAEQEVLLSVTFITLSVDDTSLILHYYFNKGQLIKVGVTNFGDFDNFKSGNSYYFGSGQLINKGADTLGPYKSTFLIERAAKMQKEFKKRPIRFPS